jgi:hypothetical protein
MTAFGQVRRVLRRERREGRSCLSARRTGELPAAEMETKMQKVDLKKEFRHLYRPSATEVTAVDVPTMDFLMIDGEGDPNTAPAYGDAVEALYAVSYTLKFAVKKGAVAIDYQVMPLEGLWWADDMAKFAGTDRSAWKWTMMIMQPDIVVRDMVEKAIDDVRSKKEPPAALPRVRFERFTEGLAAQTMHVGPFADEGPAIQRVHDYIGAAGHHPAGKHHEIYLSDIRKADPANWQTVIRQPMR